MHRLIVTSAAYPAVVAIGPGRARAATRAIRLLWRKAPVRLEAEMVRDAMLAVSGMLDARLGGPSFRDHSMHQAPGTAAILYAASIPAYRVRTGGHSTGHGLRGGRSHLLDAFDCPDPSTAAPRRAVTTTPLQALVDDEQRPGSSPCPTPSPTG